MGDLVWYGQNKTLFKSPDVSDYQPWRKTARGKATCTTDICIAQDVQQENHSAPIDRKDSDRIETNRIHTNFSQQTILLSEIPNHATYANLLH